MRCIFCKKDSASSKSVEHIMPESIGSKKRVLPRGVVCDKCNNYFARKIEGPVLSHPSMRNLRAWYQVPNKRGKFPSLRGHIGGTDIGIGLRLDQEGKPKVETERSLDSKHLKVEFEAGLPNGFLFSIEMKPPIREMSRFLCKMALETVAETFASVDGGTEEVVDAEFYDNIRTYTRYGTNYTEWPYSQRRIYPEKTMMRHPETNEWVQVGFGCCWFMNKHRETLFVFCFYGIEFVINVGGPSIRGYEEWLEENGNISPMVERLGCQLVTKGEGRSQTHYLIQE
ncbi:MAG: HNH endonuclease [Leptospirales bacterium]